MAGRGSSPDEVVTDDVAERLGDIERRLADMEQALRPVQALVELVDDSGLPVPTSHVERDLTNIAGLRWQVGRVATVIAMDDPDDAETVFLRDFYGQQTGDVTALTPVEAVQLAGALLAAARATRDELAQRRRRKPRNSSI